MAENKNNFDTTVASLFKGMDSFVSAKTVVGDAVTVNDTIILPLVDVSFGVGAGAFAGEKEKQCGRCNDRKGITKCGFSYSERDNKACQY